MVPLKVLSANVNRTQHAHFAFLEAACQEKADLVLVQEPWTGDDPARRMTKNHPAYRTLLDWEDWTVRPRVMTYVRKDRAGLRCELARATPHPDVTECNVTSPDGTRLRLTNIYNAPPGCDRAGEAVVLLLARPQAAQTEPGLVTGDFNLHHERWRPDMGASRATAQSREVVEWADRWECALLTEPGARTHDRGGTLDLTWATAALVDARVVQAEIAEDIPPPSDHEAIRIVLPGGRGARYGCPGRYRVDKTDEARFRAVLEGAVGQLHEVAQAAETGRPPAIDALAGSLADTVRKALHAATPRSRGLVSGYGWWNDDCKHAAAALRGARRLQRRAVESGQPGTFEATWRAEASLFLKRTVIRAKKDFFHAQIDAVKDPRDLFRMTKWGSTRGQHGSPPLTATDGSTAVSAAEKIALLRSALLPDDRTARDLAEPSIPAEGQVWPPFTEWEVEQAVLRAKNTAPGLDEIPPAALKLAWPTLGSFIRRLYNACLAAGHHPSAFKPALLCSIEKPGKRDRSSPRAYRLIALLSTMGKGLERAIAARLAHAAVENRILPPHYLGALPGRAATDLLQLLADDVEKAFARNRQLSVATFDIKGAFDAVLPNRMAHRMLDQGWPPHVVRWTLSFLSGRTAAIRHDGAVDEPKELPGSLPQGSPVSPVLFQLFMQPLFAARTPLALRRAGYADDGRLSAEGPTLDGNVAVLEAELADVEAWCAADGVELDYAKTGLIHFSRKRGTENPPIRLPSGETVAATDPRESLRWLGVHFDRTLSFGPHVRTAAAKASKAADALRMLGGVRRGAPASSLRRAVTAGVVPVFTYAAEVWYKPKLPGQRGTPHLESLEVALRRALRAAVPVYKTTPNPLLHHAAGVPPAALLLEAVRRRSALRGMRLDPAHPLRTRTPLKLRAPDRTRLTALQNLLPAKPAYDATLPPPRWSAPLAAVPAAAGLPPAPARPLTASARREYAAAFTSWQSTQSPRDVWLFTDASRLPDGRLGASWQLHAVGRIVASGRIPCGRHETVTDAEALGLAVGLEQALSLPTTARNLWACSDSARAVRSVYDRPRASTPGPTRRAITALAAWSTRRPPRGLANGTAAAIWVPAHAGIAGNEHADAEARAAASLPEHPDFLSPAFAKRWAREADAEDFRTWWEALPPRTLPLSFESPTPAPPAWLSAPRASLGRLLAARSGHGDFAEYHERFKHDDAECRCRCGLPTAALHFLSCRITRHLPPPRSTDLLTTSAGAAAFLEWEGKTGYYNRATRTRQDRR